MGDIPKPLLYALKLVAKGTREWATRGKAPEHPGNH
jgi:hypothetical protein